MPRPSEHASPVRSLGADEAGQLAETLKALASPSRLRVLAELVGRERTVEQLADGVGAQPERDLAQPADPAQPAARAHAPLGPARLLRAVRPPRPRPARGGPPPPRARQRAVSAHASGRPHSHDHGAGGHSHGLVHDSIKRSREGLRAVALALLVLGAHRGGADAGLHRVRLGRAARRPRPQRRRRRHRDPARHRVRAAQRPRASGSPGSPSSPRSSSARASPATRRSPA